jgi:3-octaprenyl-4-hydroxybenzoate carboxy-lyase Rift-related domain/ABC transporter substrate binding protein
VTTRRTFITLLGGAAASWPLAVRAQRTGAVKVGFLYPGLAASAAPRAAAFREGLNKGGIALGDVELMVRSADGDPDRVAGLALELLDRKIDVLVPISSLAVNAVRTISGTPIVALDLETDPVGSGLVASLSHPGRNVTGVFLGFPEFSKKWLEFLKEMMPRLASVDILRDPASSLTQLTAVQEAAELLGKPMPCAVVIGCSPVVAYSSVQKVAVNVDELDVAGGVLGVPLNVVKAKTVDLIVPAEAEVIIEGFVSTLSRARGTVRRVARIRQFAGVQRLSRCGRDHAAEECGHYVMDEPADAERIDRDPRAGNRGSVLRSSQRQPWNQRASQGHGALHLHRHAARHDASV